ncbi:hypothetical protein BDV40DRAFT_304337 [Aspergillus tamarii]|uniref:Uncharacterized protein n=1 Tax=Aspergillus tamarii TaxID=41984 RepID=A0A5N6UI33_ASPTM|nr:hypothetical protein BDV40DRAFT_304337 [Aspergillus tamarii]
MAPFGSLPQTPGRVLGCCAICGEFVGPQSASIGPGIRAADIFKSSTEWKQCVQKQGYVSGHISELEKVYLRHPWLWAWLYRAILYEPSTDKFRLTGVGFAREAPNGLIQVPAARDHFYICLRLKEEDGIKLTEAFPLGITWARSSQWATQGYPIHERCWTLTTRLLDIRLVKGHLKEFTRALQREWFGMRHYEGDVIEVLRDTDYWGRWLGVCRMAGGLIGIFYMGAFVVPVGKSIHSLFQPKDGTTFVPPFMRFHKHGIKGLGTPVDAPRFFFNGLDAESAAKWTATLTASPVNTDRLANDAYSTLPWAYLVLEDVLTLAKEY